MKYPLDVRQECELAHAPESYPSVHIVFTFACRALSTASPRLLIKRCPQDLHIFSRVTAQVSPHLLIKHCPYRLRICS